LLSSISSLTSSSCFSSGSRGGTSAVTAMVSELSWSMERVPLETSTRVHCRQGSEE
jgi:hypothetical protein